MIRLVYFIPIWIAYLFCVKIPINALGLLVTLYTYRLRNTPYDKTPKYLRLWINKEDWVGGIMDEKHPEWYADSESLPPWWRKREGTGWKSHWLYHAWRNGGDGLRRTRLGGLKVDPDRIFYKTKRFMTRYEPKNIRADGKQKAGFLCWQGLKAGLKYVWIHDVPEGAKPLHTVIKLGWRIEPKYAALSDEAVEKDLLLHIRSFATKFLRKHEDQT